MKSLMPLDWTGRSRSNSVQLTDNLSHVKSTETSAMDCRSVRENAQVTEIVAASSLNW
jgi:hypothetical protein